MYNVLQTRIATCVHLILNRSYAVERFSFASDPQNILFIKRRIYIKISIVSRLYIYMSFFDENKHRNLV